MSDQNNLTLLAIEAAQSISKVQTAMSEVSDALADLKEAVHQKNLKGIEEALNIISDHIATGYGEHLRFDVPNTYAFVEELKLQISEHQIA